MKSFKSIKSTAEGIFLNIKRLLGLAWETDKSLTLGYFGTSAIGAFFPIVASYIYKLFIDQLIFYKDIQVTLPLVLVMLLGMRYFVNIIWDFVMWGMKNIYFGILLQNKFQNTLNYKFYKKLSFLDIAHLENPQTQDLIGKASDTFTWRPMNFIRQFSFLFNNLFSYVSSFLILIPFSWLMPMALSLITIPRLLLRARYGKLEWSIYGSGAPEARKLWYYCRILSETTSVTESRIFQSQNVILGKFKKIQEYLYELNKKPVIDYVKVAVMPRFVEGIVIFIFAYIKLPEVLSGNLSVGDFTFFISLLDRLSESAGDMVLNLGEMYSENLYVDHYFDVLNLPKLIKDPKKALEIPAKPYPPRIEFQNVSFKYPGSNKSVIKSATFVIEPSENIAIVGPNGAGKTTLVKLLCRFYDVSSGKILINGVDIKKVDLASWYMYLGTLFQRFMQYSFTVKENIMLGNPKIKDDEKMKKAAKRSGASEFIDKLPKKYNQLLGRQFEGGMELSQGQWQKLAIARAFYENAPILILDEPTSAIDAESEYEIFRNLNKYYKDKTLFLVSHRFSTVRFANKIIVLDKGRIIEEGNHEELVKIGGKYATMFEKQAIGYR